MTWKIPTIEQVYNEYHKQTFFVRNGVYPKTIQNYETLYQDQRKVEQLKYFIEFIFQSGFIEAYLNDYLTRNDLSPSEFSSICYFPGNIFYLCDKNFILKRDWNLKIIKIINYKISYFLSEKNQYLKDDNAMNNLAYWISIYYFFSAFGIFNYAFDTLITNNLQDCQNFSIIVFRINEHLLKHQKINIRIEKNNGVSDSNIDKSDKEKELICLQRRKLKMP